MYKAVIFDLDGTLLDTLEDLADSTNYALSKNGLPERSITEIRSFVGNGVANLIKKALPAVIEKETAERVFADFKEHYSKHCEDKTRAYAGVEEMLDTLNVAGIKTAVVSNKLESAVKKLCDKYFGSRILAAAGDKEGRKRKPEPDAVYAALEELGAKPGEAVYVGDSDVDIHTAKNSGMECIAVSWGFRSREVLINAGAKVIADSPKELTGYILK